jgi:hypothetical protein
LRLAEELLACMMRYLIGWHESGTDGTNDLIGALILFPKLPAPILLQQICKKWRVIP